MQQQKKGCFTWWSFEVIDGSFKDQGVVLDATLAQGKEGGNIWEKKQQ
jgi:hypothetical protein